MIKKLFALKTPEITENSAEEKESQDECSAIESTLQIVSIYAVKNRTYLLKEKRQYDSKKD
jgi:hypothetical protein